MRVPLSWLREYVTFELEPEALAERLTLLGMEVKAIERTGAAWQSVVVGELLEVSPHPGSTKLRLARVRTSPDAPVLSIVCGAHNIAAGQRVPVALPGGVLPGDRRIEVTRIAGEESQGMLCSGDELGVSGDAEGILILPGESLLGAPLADLLGDVVLDVDVKPNRGDALCIVGLAREVAAATGAELRWPTVEVDEQGDATADHVSVAVEDPAGCSRFVARYLDEVRIGPSSLDVQRRLIAAGVRPISNVVDASNLVMLELGKPIHTFDAAAVAEGRIIVRRARPGERLETLDHIVRDLHPDDLLIADPSGPVGIAGVMGGASSEVSGTTTSVIVESAIFDSVSIRRTAFRHALRSEASLRFEKGQEHRLARIGADRTAQLILRGGSGRAARGVVDTDPTEPAPLRVPFRPRRVSRVLGVRIASDEQQGLLARVGVVTELAGEQDAVPVIPCEPGVPLTVRERKGALVAVIPSHRRDLVIEADIAEEVARVRGYETLPGRLPDTQMPPYRADPRRLVDAIRELLAGRGLSEVVTHALIAPEDHARLGLAPDDPRTVTAANPVSADHSQLRRSLLPGLLRVLADNERQHRVDVGIFELGPVHAWTPSGPGERRTLGILLAGAAAPPSPDGSPRPADLADLKGLIDWLVGRLAGSWVRYEPGTVREGVDHPRRTASVVAQPEEGERVVLGMASELDPRLLAGVDVRAGHVVVADLDVDELVRLVRDGRRAERPERMPAAERDIAVVVEETTPAGEVLAVIRATGGPMLREVRVFDRYQGPPLADAELSLAVRLRFEPGDRTLADGELDAIVDNVAGVLQDRLGARRRL